MAEQFVRADRLQGSGTECLKTLTFSDWSRALMSRATLSFSLLLTLKYNSGCSPGRMSVSCGFK